MLRGNLATRPFYNERLVSLGLVLIAVVAIALSIVNVKAVLGLSRERAALESGIGQNERLAAEIRTQAKAQQQAVDRDNLRELATETREANGLIDQRTFSWTTLFGLLERKLPIDVRLMAVTPKIDKDYIAITMTLQARHATDVQTFIDALESDGVFYDVLPHEEQLNDDGTTSATVEAYYLEPGATTPKLTAGQGKGQGPS